MFFRKVLILFFGASALALDSANKDLVVTSADRSIDLASQLAKINTKLTFTNGGQGTVKSIHYTVDPSVADKVAFIGATVRRPSLFYLLRTLKRFIILVD
jgi:hypothetical protein